MHFEIVYIKVKIGGGDFLPRNEKDSELVLGLISTVGTDVDEVIKDIRNQLVFLDMKLR